MRKNERKEKKNTLIELKERKNHWMDELKDINGGQDWTGQGGMGRADRDEKTETDLTCGV